ncbi:MAG: Maf family protein [Gallionella sp.]|nr:Maf family protein [Gallionella sp.]
MESPRIYLASQSPRRRELLQQMGVTIAEVLRDLAVDETAHPGEMTEVYVRRVAQAKAEAGWAAVQARGMAPLPVLAADTTVTIDGHILGKPADREDAAAMLRRLSGREHVVLSAVALKDAQNFEMTVSTSTVRFSALDEARIQAYLRTGEFEDKAGAYGIQGHAGMFVEHLNGSYSGVMGLPLFETAELLRKLGFSLP